MNSQPIPASMFLQRLKTEFPENLKLVLGLWITLAVTVWSFSRWWFAPAVEPTGAQQIVHGFSALVVVLLAYFLASTLFKRDDLKQPQEFWNTRPIRSFIFFGTKLVFAWLVIALPCAVLVTALGLLAGVGMTAVWNGLEMMMWMSVLTNLLALSCMAYPGNRAHLGYLSFFGGLVFMGILVNQPPVETLRHNHGVSNSQQGWNLLIVLIALNAWFGWRCWRIVRDKHTQERPWGLFALGVLSATIVAFAPLPGALPGSALAAPSTTLPKVTQTKSNRPNWSVGEKYGAKFITTQIELDSGKSLQGDHWEFEDSKLHIAGESNHLQTVKIGLIQQDHDTPDGISTTRLLIDHSVFDREPADHGSITPTKSSDHVDKILSDIPRRKVRIQGTVTMNRISYRELARSPLDQAFSRRHGGIVCGYDPSGADSSSRYNASWKTFSPSLVTTGAGSLREKVRFRIEDPAIPGFARTRQIDGSTSGGSAFFGNYRMLELRTNDQDVQSYYHGQQRKENGHTRSVEEWKKEVRLICEVVEKITPVELPIDIEVDLPDPDKLRDLLVKGEL